MTNSFTAQGQAQCLSSEPPGGEPPLAQGLDIPFISLLGFQLQRASDGRSELHYLPQAEHLNSFEVTHGGAVMTLLDAAMATAARSQGEMGVVTIEMKTSFMQAACGHLVAKGEVLHRTATLAFTQATVYNAEGGACAHATGTFKFVKRLAVGREIAGLKKCSNTPL